MSRKTTYYATILFIALACSIASSVKLLMDISATPAVANQISPLSLSVTVLLSFSIFWQHFVYITTSSAFNSLRFVSIGFFVYSFIFQMRLTQEVFKFQYQQLSPEVYRRALLCFFMALYAVLIIFFIWQDLVLYNFFVVLLLNGGVWLP